MGLELAVDNLAGNSDIPDAARSAQKGLAVGCCCAAMATLVPVALVQLHVVRDLPDPPGRLFNSKRVVTSKGSYPLGIPDGLLGLASYSVTLALLMTATPERPLLQRLLHGKLALDATMAIRNVRKQVTEHKRICSWCLGTAAATAGMVFFGRKVQDTESLHTV
ncbi:MAG TPA: vitamin K epoxide reductase family protein [Acidobacteriaceae bacterium]|nr:vitamin K epoxide reductase family protein [Acidobacteriaceae bacterium]